jgi:small subunit ribosomal protein S15
MLQTVAVASLIAASSWVVVPSPRTICMQSASFACQRAMTIQMEEDTPAPPPAESEERMADFTEDLLDALAADDSPLSEMDAAPVFVKNEDADALAPLPSFTNAMTVEAAKEKYRLHENDCGSSQVQVAVLTARIQYMTKHMQENKKDFASLRGLNAMVTRRRKLLEYLLREDLDEFKRITSELGIRTNQLLKPKLAGARGRRV